MLGAGRRIHGLFRAGSRAEQLVRETTFLLDEGAPSVLRRRAEHVRARQKGAGFRPFAEVGPVRGSGLGVEGRRGPVGQDLDAALGHHVGVKVHLEAVGAYRLDVLRENHLPAINLLTQMGCQHVGDI